MNDVKQVIVIRKDLKMRRGKECAQAAHASGLWLAERVKQNSKDNEQVPGTAWRERQGLGLTAAEWDWIYGNYKKVVVQVESEEALLEIYKKAQDAGLEVHMVTDAGLTEFDGVPTKTCLAIGPDESMYIDKITGELKLY